MRLRYVPAALALAGMIAGCQQQGATPGGPILSADMLRSRHEQAELYGQVRSPMLLISWYPRAQAGQMRILEQIWVDQKGHILKEWITAHGVERKEEQLTATEMPVLRQAIAHLPADMTGVEDHDLLLVSFHDGMGPWTTRVYSTKGMPQEMMPITMLVAKEGME